MQLKTIAIAIDTTKPRLWVSATQQRPTVFHADPICFHFHPDHPDRGRTEPYPTCQVTEEELADLQPCKTCAPGLTGRRPSTYVKGNNEH